MLAFLRKLLQPQTILIAPPLAEIKEELLPTHKEQIVHLGIIVGHSAKEPGAKMADGLSEYAYGKAVAKHVEAIAKSYPKIKVSVIFRDDIGISGAYDHARSVGCDCVVELHFNASDKKATGTLTLCTPDQNDVEFAHIVHGLLCSAFGREGSSRGVMTVGRSVRGAPNVYAFPEGVNCLVEPFFGDSEAALGIAKEKEYAEALCLAAYHWGIKNDLISLKPPLG